MVGLQRTGSQLQTRENGDSFSYADMLRQHPLAMWWLQGDSPVDLNRKRSPGREPRAILFNNEWIIIAKSAGAQWTKNLLLNKTQTVFYILSTEYKAAILNNKSELKWVECQIFWKYEYTGFGRFLIWFDCLFMYTESPGQFFPPPPPPSCTPGNYWLYKNKLFCFILFPHLPGPWYILM